jgi:2-oxoglutarate dehydrogenase E1 component
VIEQIKKYPNAKIVWLQEEPKNMGCWTFIAPHLKSSIEYLKSGRPSWPIYVGRASSAAPATGSHSEHERQQKELIENLFSVGKK